MHKVLLAFIAIPLLACTATVRPGPGGPPPPPPREVRREPPPPPPPPDRHRDHDHDRDRDRDRGGPRVIEGVVRDAITHQPIDRASVDITGRGIQGEMTVQTGPDGRFRTDEIPRGEFGVRVRREGYKPMNRAARMEDGVARVDFELVPERR
jgi:hypothetical protein